MEMKGEEDCSMGMGYNNSVFRESSGSLDHNQNPDQVMGETKRVDQKLAGSGLEVVVSQSPARIGGARYKECMKNHAASVGGNVLDGCGEFMQSGEDGTLEALKCAACNCHRNFHRKEIVGGGGEIDFPRSSMVHPFPLPPALPSPHFKQRMSALPSNHGHWTPIVQPVKIAFGGSGGGAGSGGGTESSSDELNFNGFQSNAAGQQIPPPFVLTKKRFRTKFSPEQKQKMLEFAEKVGWRIPKEDDPEVQRFCAEVGVKRQVLKVWMHNNKSSSSSIKKENQMNNHD